MFVFTGPRTKPPSSYVLLFDPPTQRAELARLDGTFTFNLSSRNGTDVSAQHAKIYPRKPHKDSVHDRPEDEDLFGETREQGDEGMLPEQGNPYDFRHFLGAAKRKDAGEGGYASSPDSRASAPDVAVRTPVLPARRAVEAPKKRKAASVFAAKPTAKGARAKELPTVHLQRRASERPAPSAKAKAAPVSSGSKIKSAEFVAESDDSDVDAEGELDSAVESPRRASPGRRSDDDEDAEGDDDDDEDDDDDGGGGDLEIEVPDAKPGRPDLHRNASHLHIASAAQGPPSPSNGPISLASAATSAANTPRRAPPAEIDFGDLGPDDDAEADDDGDGDVERMDLGSPEAPPARQEGRKSAGGRGAEEVDEDDPLYMEMMEGLAGGDSSEESEEE